MSEDGLSGLNKLRKPNDRIQMNEGASTYGTAKLRR